MITISFVCSRFPKKLIKHLKQERGFEIVLKEQGIYYIIGDIFPMQLIIVPKLSEEKNFWLRNLTNDIKDVEIVKRLLAEYEKHKDNKLYEALMDIIVRANWKIFQEVRGMCKALEELMKDELDAREARGIEQRIEQEKAHGIKSVVEACKSLGASWEKSWSMIADKFQLTREEAEGYMQIYW